MSSVFTAAVCDQCGGALNLETLKCGHCDVPHFLNVAKAIPIIANELSDDKYFEHRDRRVDAAILFALQRTATAHQVRLGLSLSTNKTSSTINIIGYPEDQEPAEIGWITARLGNPHYEVENTGYNRRCVVLTWQADLLGEPGARYYRLSTWDRSTPIIVSGETSLAGNECLGETIGAIIDIVLRRNQRLQEEARQELLAQQQPVRSNFLQRLFKTT